VSSCEPCWADKLVFFDLKISSLTLSVSCHMTSSVGGCRGAVSVNGVPLRHRGEERVDIDRTAGLKGSGSRGRRRERGAETK
jgi:hypothetical protein